MIPTTPGAKRTALEEAQAHGLQEGKVFVITGAYSGIGVEATKAILDRKATVVVGGRNAKLQETFVNNLKKEYGDDRVDGHLLDLGDLQSVKAFADYVNSKYNEVDCLINNAGVMNTPAGVTKDGFETQMGVNVIGHFLLNKKLLPALARANGRQVWVSSSGHKLQNAPRINLDAIEEFSMTGETKDKYDGWYRYQQSKLGNILLAKQFANEGGIEAVSLHPGAIATNLGRHMGWQVYLFALTLLLRGIRLKSIPQGAATTVACATLPSNDKRFQNQAYYVDCDVAEEAESAKSEKDMKALYDYCDKVTEDFQ